MSSVGPLLSSLTGLIEAKLQEKIFLKALFSTKEVLQKGLMEIVLKIEDLLCPIDLFFLLVVLKRERNVYPYMSETPRIGQIRFCT